MVTHHHAVQRCNLICHYGRLSLVDRLVKVSSLRSIWGFQLQEGQEA